MCLIVNANLPDLSVQIIQRQLEQVEEKQRQLEERGVAVEKALRGEAGNNFKSSRPSGDARCVSAAADRPSNLSAQQASKRFYH